MGALRLADYLTAMAGKTNMSELCLRDDGHCADPVQSRKCANLCNRIEKRGACPCLVRGCLCSDRCKCGTKKQPCTNGPDAEGSVNSMGSIFKI